MISLADRFGDLCAMDTQQETLAFRQLISRYIRHSGTIRPDAARPDARNVGRCIAARPLQICWDLETFWRALLTAWAKKTHV